MPPESLSRLVIHRDPHFNYANGFSTRYYRFDSDTPWNSGQRREKNIWKQKWDSKLDQFYRSWVTGWYVLKKWKKKIKNKIRTRLSGFSPSTSTSTSTFAFRIRQIGPKRDKLCTKQRSIPPIPVDRGELNLNVPLFRLPCRTREPSKSWGLKLELQQTDGRLILGGWIGARVGSISSRVINIWRLVFPVKVGESLLSSSFLYHRVPATRSAIRSDRGSPEHRWKYPIYMQILYLSHNPHRLDERNIPPPPRSPGAALKTWIRFFFLFASSEIRKFSNCHAYFRVEKF